jgi:hypothetical protein
MDGKAEGLLGFGLGLEPFELLGASALLQFEDLFDQDAAGPTGRGGARVLPADLLAVLLKEHMSLLRWAHGSVLQEGGPKSKSFCGFSIFLILSFLDPLPSLLFRLSLLVLLLLLSSHLALHPQLNILIDVRELPL